MISIIITIISWNVRERKREGRERKGKGSEG